MEKKQWEFFRGGYNLSKSACSIRLPYIYIWDQTQSVLFRVRAEEIQKSEGEYYQHVAVNCSSGSAWGVRDGTVAPYTIPTKAVYQTLDEICGVIATNPLVLCCSTRHEEYFCRIRGGNTENAGSFSNPRLSFGRLSVTRNNWTAVVARSSDKEQRPGVVMVGERVELHRFPRGARVCSPASCIPQASLFAPSICQVVGTNGRVMGSVRAIGGGVMDAMAAVDSNAAVALLSIVKKSGPPIKVVCLFARSPISSPEQPVFASVIPQKEKPMGLLTESPYAYLATLDEEDRGVRVHILHTEHGYRHSVYLPMSPSLRPAVYTAPGFGAANHIRGGAHAENENTHFLRLAILASVAEVGGGDAEKTTVANVCLPEKIEFCFSAGLQEQCKPHTITGA